MGPGFDEAEAAGFELLLHSLEPTEDAPTSSHFVVGDRNSVDGISRGVEAALLAGAEFSGRTAVVGFSGGDASGRRTADSL